MNKSQADVLFSSDSAEWETPQAFFDVLNKKWHFTLDPCATHANHKCEKYFTKEDDGLRQSWAGHIVFCNPPYGRYVGAWVQKAKDEQDTATTVMLLPARTDTKWFQNIIQEHALAVIFLPGRLKFGGSKNAAPFPSMLVVF